MALLRYSGGRGRGPPRADGRSSNFSTRGRGGRSAVVRSRNLTWTNGATPRGRNQPHQNNQLPRGTFTTIDPAPRTRVNRVWVNTSARGSTGSTKGNGGKNDNKKADIGGIASNVPNSSGTSSNAVMETRRDSGVISARVLAPSTVAEFSISAKTPLPRPWSNSGSTSKAGDRIWVNNRSNLDNTPQAYSGRSTNLSSGPTRRDDTQKADIGGIASNVPNSSDTSSNAVMESRRDSGVISARALAPSTVAESSISAKIPLPRPWLNSGSTSKAGNRIWVNNRSNFDNTPQASSGRLANLSSGPTRRNDTQKADIGGTASNVPNSSGTSSNAVMESRRDSGVISARALAPSTVAESSISAKIPLPRPWSNSGSTSKAGNRIWVNNRSNLDNTPQASSGRLANLSSGPTCIPVAQPPRTISGRSIQRKHEVLTQRNSQSGNLVWKNNDERKSAAAPEASVPRSPPGDRTRIVKTARSVLSSGLYTSTTQPVSRYSVSANRERKSDSTREEYFKRKTAGQVARYSGLRGGRGTIHGGRSMVAWRETKARGDNWATFTGRDLSAWQGSRAPSSYVGGRGFQYPSTTTHIRYSSRIPLAFQFAHPTSRWAARTSPWASHGAWGKWRRGTAHAHAPPELASTSVCSKNRSLIHVRGVIFQQPMPEIASLRRASPAAAAARRIAIARRSSFGPADSPLTLKAETSTNFVRSGKHGMSIRRIGSSPCATGRAAVAIPANTPETAVSVSATEASRQGTKKPAPTAGNVPLSASRVSRSPLVSSATRSPAMTAAVLRKPPGRSVVSGRASGVLAGARAKNAHVLVRNMTLYRGRGKGVMIDSADGTRGRAGKKSAKKTAKATTEPCLFFCKYGKCSKSDDECPYEHDKTKVAVCRAFLRGECDKKDECLLTHAVQTEKMPVCIFF